MPGSGGLPAWLSGKRICLPVQEAWVLSLKSGRYPAFTGSASKKVLNGTISTRAAGRGKSEKRDMEEEEAKGDLGSVIHSYTICTRFLEIK